MSTQPIVAPSAAGAEDLMPLHGIDHVELWVGNAAQAAYFYASARLHARSPTPGSRPGVRDRVSHVLEQGRIRLVLTGALTPGPRDRRPPRAATATACGDRAVRARRRATPTARRSRAAPTGVREPWEAARRARHRPPGHDRDLRRHAAHVRRARRTTTGRSCPGYVARRSAPRAGDAGLLAIDHIVGNVELGHMETWVKFYEDVFGMTEMLHFSDEDDLDRVLGADVEGRHDRQRADQVPDQRAGRGQAQVADRRVPRVLRRRGRAAHRGRHARHRRHGRASCARAASSS